MIARLTTIAALTAVLASCFSSEQAGPEGSAAGSGASSAAGSGAGSTAGSTAGSGTAASAGPVPLEDVPERAAGALCRLLAPCCDDPAGFDTRRCTDTLSGGLFELQDADPAKYTYDPDTFGACLAALDGIDSLCSEAAEMTLDVMPESCSEPFQGTVPPGGACASSIECMHPAGGRSDCDLGVCIVESTVGEGDRCFWTCTRQTAGYTCNSAGAFAGDSAPVEQGRCYTNDDLYCATSGVCARLQAAGGPCDEDGACRDGLYCDFDTATCAARLGIGQGCNGWGCEEGLYCDGDGVCAPQQPPGSPCTEFDACLDGFCDAGMCVTGGTLSLEAVFCGAGSGP